MKCNRIIKCPRCKSKNIELIEIWDGSSITYEIEDGNIYIEDGIKEYGDPTMVLAECIYCKHKWRLRNITQITDLEKVDTNG